MKLSNFKRILTNDFDVKDQPLIEKLGRNLNDGIESLFQALDGKLTFEDNFLSTVKVIEITVNDTGIPTTKTSVTLNTTDLVKGILVIAATNNSNATGFPTSTPFVSFSQNGTSLVIDNVTGLLANNRYSLRLIAFN